MEWKLIDEDTPFGHLHLGKWFATARELRWIDYAGVACEMSDGKWPWSRQVKTFTFDGRYYTHWKHLPEPPND